jgi:alginate O-acetyltransferase complex protein AlgI
LGWVLFASADISAAGGLYKALVGIGVPMMDANALFRLAGAALLLVVCVVGATELPKKVALALDAKLPAGISRTATGVVLALVLFVSIAFLVADSYNPFLYFRF